ncbi:MAG: hypothetical protein GEU26_11275 [Nitrososphaeraceae archaeon]|nr:hypothetical protein [Nitrososphaeraceae archaeon]
MNRQALNRKSMLIIYVCLLVAVSLLVDSMTSGSVFAQGTTESDAAEASEEAQDTAEPLELICTIQSLLNQAVIEYGDQNFTGAAELAQTAYLDNYEHLETPLGQLDPALKEATETMIREDVQSAIETKAPLSELQQLVTAIDGNLTTAQQLFD